MSERGEVVCWVHPYALAAGALGIECSPVQFGKDQFALVRQSDYLALREELDGWKDQHSRDSAELRSLCEQRDSFKAELSALKARIAESAVAYWHKGRVKSSPLSIGMNGKAEVGQRVRLLLEEP